MIRTLRGLYMNDVIDDHTTVHVKTFIDGRGIITIAKGKWYNDQVIEYFERDITEYNVLLGDNSVEIYIDTCEEERNQLDDQFDAPMDKLGEIIGRVLFSIPNAKKERESK